MQMQCHWSIRVPVHHVMLCSRVRGASFRPMFEDLFTLLWQNSGGLFTFNACHRLKSCFCSSVVNSNGGLTHQRVFTDLGECDSAWVQVAMWLGFPFGRPNVILQHSAAIGSKKKTKHKILADNWNKCEWSSVATLKLLKKHVNW